MAKAIPIVALVGLGLVIGVSFTETAEQAHLAKTNGDTVVLGEVIPGDR